MNLISPARIDYVILFTPQVNIIPDPKIQVSPHLLFCPKAGSMVIYRWHRYLSFPPFFLLQYSSLLLISFSNPCSVG
jgi:hypothetical protein